MRKYALLVFCWLALLLPLSGQQSVSTVRTDEDEKLLKEAGYATDDEALLRYFRAHSLSKDRQSHVKNLIVRLGHERFAVRERAMRELIRVGAPALPLLKEARDHAELEVQMRSRKCIEEIEKNPHAGWTIAAARLLAKRRPAGAVQALLEYLPSSDWDTTGDELLKALTKLAIAEKSEDVDPALLEAAKSQEPIVRLAVAFVLGEASPRYQQLLQTLQKDANDKVRFQAALSLLRHHNARGVDTLLELLTDAPMELALQAEDILLLLDDKNAPDVTLGYGEKKTREHCREAWNTWWRDHQKSVKLDNSDLQRYLASQTRGLVITCEIDKRGDFPGRICAYDRTGKLRWTIEDLRSPNDFQMLRNGRILVAEFWANRVTERDRSGKVFWEYKAGGHVVSCARLRNGHTLIGADRRVLVVSADKKIVFSFNHDRNIHHVQCLANGHFLLIDSRGQVVEVDKGGNKVMSFTPATYASGASSWSSVDLLPNGRYLICLSGTNKVVETDKNGQILWECDVPSPVWALRLRNGNTWIGEVNNHALRLVDRNGRQLERWQVKGRPFCIREY